MNGAGMLVGTFEETNLGVAQPFFDYMNRVNKTN